MNGAFVGYPRESVEFGPTRLYRRFTGNYLDLMVYSQTELEGVAGSGLYDVFEVRSVTTSGG